MRLRCPACQTLLEVGDHLAGKLVACTCGQQLRVPQLKRPAVTPKAAPAVLAKAAPSQSQQSEQPIVVACSCGRKLQAPGTARGKRVRCPCGQLVDVPRQQPLASRPAHSEPQVNHLAHELVKIQVEAAEKQRRREDEEFHAANNPYATDFNSKYQGSGHNANVGNAESIRRQCIQHEATIREMGALYIIGSCASFLSVAGILLGAILGGRDGEVDFAGQIMLFVLGGVMAIVAGFQLWFAIKLRAFEPWTRPVATVFSVLGLLGIPLGTLISIFQLIALQSTEANQIFSPEYKEIIRRTPHIKPRPSILLWILLAILGLMLLGGLVFFILLVVGLTMA